MRKKAGSTQDWNESTVNTEIGGAAYGFERPEVGHCYLLVVDGDTSSMFQLPAIGDAVIGRADDADLQLRRSSVSRKHARLSVGPGEARITDLGSQNGTFVNGERIGVGRALVSGDIISICTTSLVFHSNKRTQPTREIRTLEHFRSRVEEEIERGRHYQRPLAVGASILGLGVADRPAVARALMEHVRVIDIVAWGGADQLLFLFPEVDADEALEHCSEALAHLKQVAPKARFGVSVYPTEGCDVDTLVASARAAAIEAKPGTAIAASESFGRLEIGGRAVVVADPAMNRLMVLVKRLAVADLPVLVCGETGTGKDVVAHAIHQWSPRAEAPLVNLNCAAVPDNLLEGELFGYEKGAFSGALAAKPGLLETGAGGTVFLDEVGELSASSQAKLLRVLETKRVTRLGGVNERSIDIRIVAATNRDLATEVTKGGFRQDLFYRLSGATVWIPPLRDRQRELPILAQLFLDEACNRLGRPAMELADDGLRALAAYEWPGNVRELKNVIDFVTAAHADTVVEARHLLPKLGAQAGPGADQTSPGMLALSRWELDRESRAATTAEMDAAEATPPPQSFRPLDEELRELEKRRMAEALAAADGNQTKAAKLIGMPLRTFQAKVKQHGLRKRARTAKRS